MHRRSIPSPAPSFFPTTTTLKAYGLLDSFITPFLSMISTCSFIHWCSLGVWYSIFPTTGTSLINLMACSTLVQFPISCAPLTRYHHIRGVSFVPLRDMYPLFHIRGSLFLPQGVAYPALGPIAKCGLSKLLGFLLQLKVLLLPLDRPWLPTILLLLHRSTNCLL